MQHQATKNIASSAVFKRSVTLIAGLEEKGARTSFPVRNRHRLRENSSDISFSLYLPGLPDLQKYTSYFPGVPEVRLADQEPFLLAVQECRVLSGRIWVVDLWHQDRMEDFIDADPNRHGVDPGSKTKPPLFLLASVSHAGYLSTENFVFSSSTTPFTRSETFAWIS